MKNNQTEVTSSLQNAISTVEALSLEDQNLLIEIIQNRLQQEKQRTIAEQIYEANQEEAEESYQAELADWDITLGDGLS